jgi:hypothetical protein
MIRSSSAPQDQRIKTSDSVQTKNALEVTDASGAVAFSINLDDPK